MDRKQELIEEIRRKQLIQSITQKMNAPKEPDMIVDEMPEWLSTADRATVKNLTNNSDEAIAHLQKQYPDAEFKSSGDDILARKKGESVYGKLDPSFSPFSNPIGTLKDLGRDALDLGYDAVQMGGEAIGGAAGAVGGGLAGALTGNPAGVALGMGAGGVAGAGAGAGAASTLKQMLRKRLGIADEIDMGEIATDATLGAAIPVAFSGAGKALGHTAKKTVPKLYAKATGLTESALGRIADKGDELAKMDESGALNVLHGVEKDVGDWIGTKKKDFAEKYKKIRGGSEDIDLLEVKKVLKDKYDEAAAQYNETGMNAFKEQMDAYKAMDDEIFGATAKDSIGISNAMDLDSVITNNWIDYADDVGQGVGKGRTVSSQQQELAKQLKQKLRDNVNKASYGSLQNTADEYSQFVDQINYLRKNFKNPEKIEQTLKRVNDGKSISAAGGFQKLDPALVERINQAKGDLDLYRYFKPTNDGLLTEEGLKEFAMGKSPLEKLMGPLGAGIGYTTGGAPGAVVGGALGRGGAKLFTSPGSVKAITKAAKKLNMRADVLMKAIEENPMIMDAIYGGTYAASTR